MECGWLYAGELPKMVMDMGTDGLGMKGCKQGSIYSSGNDNFSNYSRVRMA